MGLWGGGKGRKEKKHKHNLSFPFFPFLLQKGKVKKRKKAKGTERREGMERGRKREGRNFFLKGSQVLMVNKDELGGCLVFSF
jgi:hypothetical protein